MELEAAKKLIEKYDGLDAVRLKKLRLHCVIIWATTTLCTVSLKINVMSRCATQITELLLISTAF